MEAKRRARIMMIIGASLFVSGSAIMAITGQDEVWGDGLPWVNMQLLGMILLAWGAIRWAFAAEK